jgi:transposase
MEQKIIFATGNQGKMREIRAILSDLGLPVLSMKEAGVSLDITEDGTSFAENARIKARAVWEHTGGQMIPVWQWIISAASRAFILRGIWERIPPMRLKTEIS